MGLDMWLKKSDDEEVMYWRKANQIRGWLVSHDVIQDEDNCVPRLVTKEKLKNLVEDCKAVLEDHSKAEELMPVTSGFFFGSEKYDEWYFEDLQRTVDTLEPLLEKDETKYIYEDWW